MNASVVWFTDRDLGKQFPRILTEAGLAVERHAELFSPTGSDEEWLRRHQRKATWSTEKPDGRWRVYEYEELVARDKASLDVFWLRDETLADSDNLPPPEVIAQEIVDDLEAALEQFRLIAVDLNGNGGEPVNLPPE